MKPHGVGPFPDYVDPVTINPPPAKEPVLNDGKRPTLT